MSGNAKFNELKKIFAILHGPNGCLWDKQQTHRTILPHLEEEVDEFIDAVKVGDPRQMKEEIGDILLHVMFHATIAQRENEFTIDEVIEGLIAKLKRRHPHVFSTAKVNSTKDIMANWKKIKKREKGMQHEALTG